MLYSLLLKHSLFTITVYISTVYYSEVQYNIQYNVQQDNYTVVQYNVPYLENLLRLLMLPCFAVQSSQVVHGSQGLAMIIA